METSDILKKVRKIEIKTRGLSQNIFAGQYHSAFKGRGMAFSEVREYQYGDDVRDIDWNVTARFHRPYVKVFEEERETYGDAPCRRLGFARLRYVASVEARDGCRDCCHAGFQCHTEQ